jgi:hypothetical protein
MITGPPPKFHGIRDILGKSRDRGLSSDWYEEPTLVATDGAEYEAYRAGMPAWIPRLRPRKPG